MSTSENTTGAIPPKLDSIEPEAGGLPAGVKVKPLEWSDNHSTSCVGGYRVQRLGTKWEPLHDGYFMLPRRHGVVEAYDTAEAAKAAAQADYERRILSAIEVVPVRAMELRRYIERCKELSAQGEYTWWSRLAEILSALAASPAPVAVPAGYRLVPDTALAWLMGEGPDADGHWFGDNSKNQAAKGAFWWRKSLRAMLSASPVPSTATQAGAVTRAGDETDGGAE